MGTGQWSGVDGKRRGENGSGGEPEMRAASGHSEWLGVLDFRLVIFFFNGEICDLDFRLVSNLGEYRLQICGFGIGILNRFRFGVGLD